MTRLQAIRARVEAATKGPWATADDDTIYSNPQPAEKGGTYFDTVICQMSEDLDTDEVNFRDTEFICHARDDVPYLLARLQRAEQILRSHSCGNPTWARRIANHFDEEAQ